MTNSQCIEVVEKVWGWKRTGGKWRDYPENNIWEDSKGSIIRYWDGLAMTSIEQCVNSWTGFGRTVEAMAEKGLYFDSKNTGDWNPEEPKTLIEATHLAALEAIKSEFKQQS